MRVEMAGMQKGKINRFKASAMQSQIRVLNV